MSKKWQVKHLCPRGREVNYPNRQRISVSGNAIDSDTSDKRKKKAANFKRGWRKLF